MTKRAISFSQSSSVVVVGAHPDDAVRACGGVMLHALAAGATVTVLAVTDGAALFGKAGIDDGRATARARKAEQLRGLRKLGVNRESVFFLGFPDGGIAKLRHVHHTGRAEPYFCPWLKADHSDRESFGPRIAFNAEALLTLLSDILRPIAPTHVFTHHARDKHPDHRGVTWFVRNALSQLLEYTASARKGGGSGDPPPHGRGRRVSRPAAKLLGEPAIFEYLTYLRGTRWPPPGRSVPPAAARALRFPGRVVEVHLSPAESKRKDAALDRFVPVLGPDYIAHWRRTNEIFWQGPRDT